MARGRRRALFGDIAQGEALLCGRRLDCREAVHRDRIPLFPPLHGADRDAELGRHRPNAAKALDHRPGRHMPGAGLVWARLWSALPILLSVLLIIFVARGWRRGRLWRVACRHGR